MSDGELLDTNVLTAFRDFNHPRHEAVDRLVSSADASLRLHIAPQSLYEFWVVATRPRDVNGFGMSPTQATLEIESFRDTFIVLPDPPGLLDAWLDLCRSYGVSGKNAHDARIAAYARLTGVSTLVTLNPRDFARYGLNVVVP